MVDDVTLEELSEWVWRWKNHYRMLDLLSESTNTDPDLVRQWREKVDECFREKMRARL
jgi:hypothetical protein